MFERPAKEMEAHLRATIEEELGAFRQFADLPATEIEEMAARIARAVAPYVAGVRSKEPATEAA